MSADNKCRICGYEDANNVNIFSEAQSSLVNKIRTVFPILLYKNDPLPKSICKKCIATVSFMYVDIQRVIKLQHKWIQSVRSNDPDNSYICILNMIEMANRGTRQTVKTMLSEDIFVEWIERVALALPTPTTTSIPATTTKSKNNQNNHNNNNNYIVNKCEKNCKIKLEQKNDVDNDGKLCDIKSLLESNGCSLLAVKNKPKRNATTAGCSLPERESKTRKLTNTKVKPVAIINNSNTEEEMPFLVKRTSRQTCAKKSTNTNTVIFSPSHIDGQHKCTLCTQSFQSVNELAIHQVVHMRLQIPRIFERKCLSKRERRGRLINVNEKQCIRCLNCWRIFDDNKDILTHWTMSNCDFYCQICGKEFAHAPKMLREHVPAAHGVNYRSTKMQHQRFAPLPDETNIMDTSKQSFLLQNYEKPKATVVTAKPLASGRSRCYVAKVKQMKDSKRAVCPICCTWFQNMKARNSHMRKHKLKNKSSLSYEETPATTITAAETIGVIIKQEVKVLAAAGLGEVEKQVNVASEMANEQEAASDNIVNIKTEPLDITDDDVGQECQVCHHIITGTLVQHTCF